MDDAPLDRSETSAAQDNGEYDMNTPSDDDGRTGLRTRFYPEEALDTQKYQRLRNRHETRESKQAAREAGRRRDGATWCNALDMTDFQRDRVLYLVDRVSFDETLNGYDFDAIEGVLAIIVHVAAEDGRELIRLVSVHEDPQVRTDDPRFQTICDHVGTTASRVASVRELCYDAIRAVK